MDPVVATGLGHIVPVFPFLKRITNSENSELLLMETVIIVFDKMATVTALRYITTATAPPHLEALGYLFPKIQ